MRRPLLKENDFSRCLLDMFPELKVRETSTIVLCSAVSPPPPPPRNLPSFLALFSPARIMKVCSNEGNGCLLFCIVVVVVVLGGGGSGSMKGPIIAQRLMDCNYSLL